MRRDVWMAMTLVLSGPLLWTGWSAAQPAGAGTEAETPSMRGERGLMRTGTWKAGGGFGFLAETPDDTAFAVDLHGDRFVNDQWSVGPLGQFAFTGDLAQYALSGQLKYWLGLPDPNSPMQLVFQGGVGIVHAAFQNGDTSWLVPLGIGVDYAVDSLQIYATFLLNLTDLNTGRGTSADVMPGVTFGVKF